MIDWLASRPIEEIEEILNEFSENALLAFPWLFDFWAHDHQLPPDCVWDTWVILGGRGAGKTRAGAEWVRNLVEGSRPKDKAAYAHIALVGETYDQVRDVMIHGESGIIACTPSDRKPVWSGSERKLRWPNGAVAWAMSGSSPEAMRGPQFDAAWIDELAKWPDPISAWTNLQFTLRLGEHPKQVVTTTPRDIPLLRELLERRMTEFTHAATSVNSAYLARGFVDKIKTEYGGTRLAQQEIEGLLVSTPEGALWSASQLDQARNTAPPILDRVVVAVDPPVSGHAKSDACGIVIAGRAQNAEQAWNFYVLDDWSIGHASPHEWGQRVLAAFHHYQADLIVAEVNQGGDLVEALLRQSDPLIPFKPVRATRGKVVRAEPIAALYAQSRVWHVGKLTELEDEMLAMTQFGYSGRGSPDRVDALVWALTELSNSTRQFQNPSIRNL